MSILPKLARSFIDMMGNLSVAKPRPVPVAAVPPPKPAPPPEPTKPGFDRAAFFAVLRGTNLRHQKPSQVEGTELILDKMHGLPTSWVAYALATTWHETAATMQPIKEYGGPAYFMDRYDITGKKPHIARALGNTQPGDGARFAGRGYVQLTGRANYDRAGKAVRQDLLGNPDLAMRPDIAAQIMRAGMLEGWFTGRKFSTTMPADIATREQFREARRIINGTDKADKIAGHALDFQAALVAGGWK